MATTTDARSLPIPVAQPLVVSELNKALKGSSALWTDMVLLRLMVGIVVLLEVPLAGKASVGADLAAVRTLANGPVSQDRVELQRV